MFQSTIISIGQDISMLSTKYPAIAVPSRDILDRLDHELTLSKRKDDSNGRIALAYQFIAFSILEILLYPIAASLAMSGQASAMNLLALILLAPSWLSYGLAIATLLIVIYVVYEVINIASMVIAKKPAKLQEATRISTIFQGVYLVWIIYVIVPGIIFLFVSSYGSVGADRLESLVSVWILVPCVLLVTGLIIAVLMVVRFVVEPRTMWPRDKTASSAIFHAVELLKKLDAITSLSHVSIDDRAGIIAAIYRVALRISNINPELPEHDTIAQWSELQFMRASENFVSLVTWVVLPQPTTLDDLRFRVCQYLNVLLSGDFHDFPREDNSHLGESVLVRRGPQLIRGIVELLPLLLFIVVPAIVFALLGNRVAPTMQPIAYVAWLVLSLPVYIKYIAPQDREALNSVLPVLFSRL